MALTRARRQLHLYVPVRYYHRPSGSDDAHGYGKPSRFLTNEVQKRCDVIRASEQLSHQDASTATTRRITVSIDGLFE